MFSFRTVNWTPVALAALAVFLLAVGGNYILYAHAIAYDLPEGDHWRWLRGGLIPLVEGDIGFRQYLTMEFIPLSHSHILTLGEVWLNYKLFGLDYRLESLAGLVAMLAAFTLLCLQYWKRPGQQVPLPAKAAVLACFALVLLKQSNVISWTLVQFENIYFLITIGYLVVADRALASGKGRTGFLAATLGVFLLGDAMGIAAILAVMGYMVLFSPTRHYRLLLQLVALLIVSIVLSLPLIRGVNPIRLLELDAGPGVIQYVLNNFTDFCKVVLMLFSEALGAPGEYRYYFAAWALARYIVGFGVACFMGMALVSYFVYRERLVESRLPVLLVLLTLATLAGIIITRFEGFGLDIASANRYIRLFQVGLVGALWINSAMLVKVVRERELLILPALASIASVTVLVSGFLMGSYYLWRYIDGTLRNREEMAAAFISYASDDTYPVGDYHARCRNHYCKDAIAFLEENNLSIFRDDQ